MSDNWKIPSIGRIVHYNLGHGRWLPAIILAVHELNNDVIWDCKVDLEVFGITEQRIRYNVSEGANDNQWRWPPVVKF